MIYFIIILGLLYYYNSHGLKMLNFVVIIFNLNIYIIFLYFNYNILYALLVSFLIIMISKLYEYIDKIILKKDKMTQETILIKNGIINFKELIDNEYNYNKLLTALKRKGIKEISSIEYCIKKDNDLLILKNSGITNYPISVIIDGEIIYNNLLSINKNDDWLKEEMERNNLNLESINYAYYKRKKLYFIVNV